MTQSLERAIAELQKLPDSDQDAIAAIIIAEIADDQRWDAAFAASQSQLSQIAEKVRRDIRAGRVRDLGIDEL
jgi:hypothetical protein